MYDNRPCDKNCATMFACKWIFAVVNNSALFFDGCHAFRILSGSYPNSSTKFLVIKWILNRREDISGQVGGSL